MLTRRSLLAAAAALLPLRPRTGPPTAARIETARDFREGDSGIDAHNFPKIPGQILGLEGVKKLTPSQVEGLRETLASFRAGKTARLLEQQMTWLAERTGLDAELFREAVAHCQRVEYGEPVSEVYRQRGRAFAAIGTSLYEFVPDWQWPEGRPCVRTVRRLML